MPKAHGYQPNLAGGEFSPRMEARIDFQKYSTAVSRAKNMVALPQGGMTFCPGTRYVGTAAGDGALVAFRPAADQSYVLEMTGSNMRIWKDQALMTASTTTASITNGSFSADISGWTDVSSGGGSIAWRTGGGLFLEPVTDGTSAAEQSISIPVADRNKLLTIRWSLLLYNQKVRVTVGTTSGGDDLFDGKDFGPGAHMISFVPGVATIYLRFAQQTTARSWVANVAFLSNVPLSLTTPWTATQAKQLSVAQKADVMYVFHPSHRPRRIERRGDASWSVVLVYTSDGPWLEINPENDLAEKNYLRDPSFEGGIQEWTDASEGSGFLDYDKAQRAVFFSVRGDTHFSGIQKTFNCTAGLVHVMHFQAVAQNKIEVTVTSGGSTLVSANYIAGWYTVSFTPGASTFTVKIGNTTQPQMIAGLAGVFIYSESAHLLKPAATTPSTTVTAHGFAPFKSTDVGRNIRLEYPGREPAWGIITGYTSATQVGVYFYRTPPVAGYCESWRLGSWNDALGWPSVGTFFQQRLFAASNADQPQTLWGSQSGDFENFGPDSFVEGALTVEDDDGFNYTIAGEEASQIYWMSGARVLLVGTKAGPWAVTSQGQVLTPNDFSADLQASSRIAKVAPVKINDVTVYVHGSKRRAYDIGYRYEIDGYQAANLSILADHILKSPLEELAFQSESVPIIWGRLNDGTLACCTYNRDQEVVGWTPRTLGGNGVVRSMATIPGQAGVGQVYPSDDRDELWLLVRRTIGGSTVHYIEVMEGFFRGENKADYDTHSAFEDAQKVVQVDAFHVDCGLTYKGSSTTTISGLSHLNGQTVKVVVNGAVQSDKTVASGQITLDEAPSGQITVHVGLGYDWRFRSLKLAYGAAAGSGITATKKVFKLGLVLLDSGPFQYAVEYDRQMSEWTEHAIRRTDMDLGEAVPLYTGEMARVTLDGSNSPDPRLHLKSDLPLPFTILGIVPSVETHEQL